MVKIIRYNRIRYNENEEGRLRYSECRERDEK